MINTNYDVIIIGGGVVGCAVARELTKYALKIALLEKSTDICAGQSKANTAIIHGGYDAKPGTKKAYYNVLGNKMFGSVCEELDVPHEWNGSLVVSFAPDQDEKIYELYERGQKNGVPGLGVITHDEIIRREPNINPAARLALDVRNGGICCPYELTIAFAENAAKNGADFFRSSPVTSVRRENDAWIVETPSHIFSCKAVVNCAGMYSDDIHNMVSKDRLSIQPRRGEYYLIDKKYASAFHSAIFQVPSKMGKGILIARTVDGTTLVGPTAEDIEDKADTRSSNYLEDAATEIQVQGLELDYTCLLWDADMRYKNGKWHFYRFNGKTQWNELTGNTENQQEQMKYMLNAYRVLLTRARAGMVICVPEGNPNKTPSGFWEDSTRLPEYYNGTYQYLKDLGLEEI